MLNVISLQGRLVKDPEMRTTSSGISVANFTIAVQRNTKTQGGERESDFIDIVCWRHTAEFVCKYARKGGMVCLNGSLQTRNYEDKNGNKRKAYEVVADNVHLAGDRFARTEDSFDAGEQQSVQSVPDNAPAGYVDVDVEDLPF